MPEMDEKKIVEVFNDENASLSDYESARRTAYSDPSEMSALEEAAKKLKKDYEKATGAAKRRLAACYGAALWTLKCYDEATEILPDAGENPATLVLLGRSLRSLGRLDDAVEAFDKAASVGADKFLADMEKADILRSKGEVAEARKLVNKNAKSNQGQPRLHLESARCLEADGEYEEAMAEYEKALELDGEYVPAMFRLAYLCDLRGLDDRALELYERCAAIRPQYVNALINLGVVYEQRSEYEKAAQCYRRVLDSDPQNARARMFLKDAEAARHMYYDEEAERRLHRTGKVLRSPISDFDMTIRSRNALKKMNINTLGDLVKHTEEELLNFKNFGEQSLNEIKRILVSKGLHLGMKVDTTAYESELPAPRPAAEREMEELLMMSIDQLDLSIRSRKCLISLGLETVGDLLKKTPEELLQVKNFGETSLQEVREKLAELGLELNEPEEAEGEDIDLEVEEDIEAELDEDAPDDEEDYEDKLDIGEDDESQPEDE